MKKNKEPMQKKKHIIETFLAQITIPHTYAKQTKRPGTFNFENT